MREYDHFQKGATNSNTSTLKHKNQLEDSDKKITTIKNYLFFMIRIKNAKFLIKKWYFFFEERYRGQFGIFHFAISKTFKKYFIFLFIGTPIINIKVSSSNDYILKTIDQAFGDQLYSYTMVNVIKDGNVFPFNILFTL